MNRLALPILVVVAALAVSAEPVHAQKLMFGVRGGLNYATADVKGSAFAQDVGARTGFHAGILGAVEISKNFAIQTEVMYSQKGFGKGDGDLALSLNYIEIPVLAVIKIPGNISPHFYLGPVLGLETLCKVTFAGESVDCDQASEGLPRTKGADSGIIFGAGVTLDAGFSHLLLDAWYNHGLTHVAEPSEEVENIQTRTVYLSVGFARPIGN